jgi:hypothetical protein
LVERRHLSTLRCTRVNAAWFTPITGTFSTVTTVQRRRRSL